MTDLNLQLKRLGYFHAALLLGCLAGCSQQHAFIDSSKQTRDADRQLLKQVSYEEPVKPDCGSATCGEPPPFALDSDAAQAQY